tara:strand:- start:459 stop:731 length:273 start_codon:yes stop_codon:yes gene_type:complete
MANDYVFFDPRKKAQQQEEDKKKLTELEEERLRNQEMGEKAVKIIADFTVKPFVLMLVWNMTVPTFGIATIGYFGAVGLYIIARILFKHD